MNATTAGATCMNATTAGATCMNTTAEVTWLHFACKGTPGRRRLAAPGSKT